MKAKILYDRLDNDFIFSELSDIWAKYMVPVYDFLTENFKVRSMGLVCDFAEEITKVYSAVFPTDKILQQIIDSGTTDAMLFLHHPSIWDIRTTPTFKQMNPALVKKLQERKILIKRYMNVGPSNRLVAFELEKLWNLKMNELVKVEEELRNHENSKKDETGISDVRKLLELPNNMKDIWKSGNANIQDKKRILRCLIENITITKEGATIRLGVCFKGGTCTVLECINPPMKYTTWTTSDEVLDIIRKESTCHTPDEISEILTNAGYKSGKGGKLTAERVTYLQRTYEMPSYTEYLHNEGYLTAKEKAVQLGIRLAVLHQRKNAGEFEGKVFRSSGKGDYMFAPD